MPLLDHPKNLHLSSPFSAHSASEKFLCIPNIVGNDTKRFSGLFGSKVKSAFTLDQADWRPFWMLTSQGHQRSNLTSLHI